MEEVIGKYISDFPSAVSSYMGDLSIFVSGGLLTVVVFWTIGIVVRSMYGWLNEWTSVR